jgi:hypothetical protein
MTWAKIVGIIFECPALVSPSSPQFLQKKKLNTACPSLRSPALLSRLRRTYSILSLSSCQTRDYEETCIFYEFMVQSFVKQCRIKRFSGSAICARCHMGLQMGYKFCLSRCFVLLFLQHTHFFLYPKKGQSTSGCPFFSRLS